MNSRNQSREGRNSVSHEEFTEMMRFVKTYLNDSVENDGDRMRWFPWHSPEYRYDHILGAVEIAEKIAREEGADVDVVKVAALFHDVAKFQVDQEEHAKEGAEIARQYLKDEGYSEEFIYKVTRTIKDHTRSMDEELPLESKVMMEADAIDKIGVGGATLMTLRVGYESRSYDDVPHMIDRVIDRGESILDWIETETGRRIVRERIERTKTFKNWFEDEMP